MYIVVSDGNITNGVVNGIEGSVATDFGHIYQRVGREFGECAAASGLAVEPLGCTPAAKCLIVVEIVVKEGAKLCGEAFGLLKMVGRIIPVEHVLHPVVCLLAVEVGEFVGGYGVPLEVVVLVVLTFEVTSVEDASPIVHPPCGKGGLGHGVGEVAGGKLVIAVGVLYKMFVLVALVTIAMAMEVDGIVEEGLIEVVVALDVVEHGGDSLVDIRVFCRIGIFRSAESLATDGLLCRLANGGGVVAPLGICHSQLDDVGSKNLVVGLFGE